MKKRFVALMIAAMAAVQLLAVTAFAGVTVTDPDPYIEEMSVIWYDEAGNEHRETIRPRKDEPAQPEQDPIAGSTVTWQDAAGNTYISDGTTVIVIPAGN